jgi:hypothetical protein
MNYKPYKQLHFMKKIMIVFAMFFLFSCDDKATARRVLENNGYTDIELTGYKAFCCGDDDGYSTGFRARGQNGKIVTGCVCSSMFQKGATIRFE